MGTKKLFLQFLLFMFSSIFSFTIFSATIFAQEFPLTAIGIDLPANQASFVPATKSEDLFFVNILSSQQLGIAWPFNPVKYAIRGAISAGVPVTTIVMLLLLPLAAAFIASARHIGGLRGFGIFFPAALSIVFLAIGPVLGILLFVTIVAFSILTRTTLKKLKIKIQYLPRMSLILLIVSCAVLGILFLAPIVKFTDLSSVSIFPVLILVLLSEDFSKVQTGKSARTAIALASETLILSLSSFLLLTLVPLKVFALLHPEILLLSILVANFVLGRYAGLRISEYWRYRKLLSS